MRKIAFVGYGGSGKDTAGDWFGDNTVLHYSPDWSACSRVILQHFLENRKKYGFNGMEIDEIYASRRENRKLWYDVGNELRAHDPQYLVKECLKKSDIVTGIRDGFELEACRELLSLIIWIDRPGTSDPTVTFSPQDADIIVPNHGSMDIFYSKLKKLADSMTVTLPASPFSTGNPQPVENRNRLHGTRRPFPY